MSIIIEGVRLAFGQGLYKKQRVKQDDVAKYGCTFIMSKDHPQLDELWDAVDECIAEKWGKKNVKPKLPIHDGEEKDNLEGFTADDVFFAARNKTKPRTLNYYGDYVDEDDETAPYSGCWVDVDLEVWAQDNEHGKRVNFSLGDVQFDSHDAPFEGGYRSEEGIFGDKSQDGEGPGEDQRRSQVSREEEDEEEERASRRGGRGRSQSPSRARGRARDDEAEERPKGRSGARRGSNRGSSRPGRKRSADDGGIFD